MAIWTGEIKELEALYSSLKGRRPDLEIELEQLIKAADKNMVMIYARRALEVVITELCERELNMPRGTQPLAGIIDKLKKEEKVPDHIIVSMRNLNSLSVFGAHPKDFNPRQVKPVLLDLTTVLEWYFEYFLTPDTISPPEKVRAAYGDVSGRKRRRILIHTVYIQNVSAFMKIDTGLLKDRLDLDKKRHFQTIPLEILSFERIQDGRIDMEFDSLSQSRQERIRIRFCDGVILFGIQTDFFRPRLPLCRIGQSFPDGYGVV